MSFIQKLFRRDFTRHEGVRPINIWLMRVLYLLMSTLLAMDVWSYVLGHQGAWTNQEAIAWSVWGAFSTLAILGLFQPLKMIPILLLEIFYKTMWLILVAYPLWKAGTLAGSNAEANTYVFLPVILVYLILPWGYVFRTYVLGRPALKA
ncbi:MAG TPA: hypothetical protein VGH71_07900 [Gammaproteobacteria bacterium]|jgi:hypothetical protein